MSMNSCNFTGRLTRDPELKTTSNGKSVVSFSIAVDNGYGDNKRTAFPDMVAWEKTAEFIARLTKGTLIAVTCRYEERKYQDSNGNDCKAREFVVDNVTAMSPKSE